MNKPTVSSNVASVRKPAMFGNKRPRQWDNRPRRSMFDTFQNVKTTFDAAVRDARWTAVLVAGQELLSIDVGDFNQGELLFYTTALPRVRFYIDKASETPTAK